MIDRKERERETERELLSRDLCWFLMTVKFALGAGLIIKSENPFFIFRFSSLIEKRNVVRSFAADSRKLFAWPPFNRLQYGTKQSNKTKHKLNYQDEIGRINKLRKSKTIQWIWGWVSCITTTELSKWNKRISELKKCRFS